MLTYEDCLAVAGVSEAEVNAIARHRHVPEVVAVEYASYLAGRADGDATLAGIIRDDIEVARRRGNLAEAARLRLVLRHVGETPRRAA
jgi:hypothetical protein